MKLTSSLTHQRRRLAGFTLIEVLVVIAIMALLASLTMYGFRYANIMSRRQHSTTYHAAIKSGLEAYNGDNGEYPIPRDQQQAGTFQGKRYNIGGARMLYQALTGDGDDQIKLANPANRASDGSADTAQELQRIYLKECPPQVKLKTNDGWMMVDGFAHPFQYYRVDYGNGASRDVSGTRTSQQANVQTVNPTYDLWSYGEDDSNTSKDDLSTRLNNQASALWIKNW
jgi:prepilin-type N-terminal cleavage/methylation domain-containing protein